MAQVQQEDSFAEVTPVQEVRFSKVAVTIRSAGAEADVHSGADAAPWKRCCGYHDLGTEITVVGCWAHLRRKFDDAAKSLPKGRTKGSSAYQGMTYCNLLFGIEQETADKTAQERYEERLKQAKPVLDAFLARANSRTAAP